jgi:hypothetical protein
MLSLEPYAVGGVVDGRACCRVGDLHGLRRCISACDWGEDWSGCRSFNDVGCGCYSACRGFSCDGDSLDGFGCSDGDRCRVFGGCCRWSYAIGGVVDGRACCRVCDLHGLCRCISASCWGEGWSGCRLLNDVGCGCYRARSDPVATAIALRVSEAGTVIAAVYFVDAVVGAVPLVV